MNLSHPESRPVVPSGKFFSRNGDKFFFKAVRLNAATNPLGLDQQVATRQQLIELQSAHTTALIFDESQADALLGLAAHVGLYALVEISAPPEELLSRAGFGQTLSRINQKVRSLRCYPAIVGYLIDCPIEPDRLRYYGLERLKRRLHRLLATIHTAAPGKLACLKHQPATIGLSLTTEDLLYTAIPPLSPDELRSYVVRLHNIAEARPLVLEFRRGFPDQDHAVACAFAFGAAGVVALSLAPPAHATPLAANPLAIKMLSARQLMPFLALNGCCPPKPAETPMVSVVICAYNAERTMRQCLESLRRLDYPNFEVIVVDDGSCDATAQITADFPEFRLIRQPNRGLSTARNVGLHAARGEIIAYTDSDCVVDPHWLSFIIRTMTERGFDGCGGPNYAPQEDGWIEACVAASPGAPCHVLTGDDRAEHLAGCNMVYRKQALLAVGGFDPQFTAAGDDVDICWRLLDAGLTLGYCPAAYVWHFRRNTVSAYYGQQRGYGKAEALLYLKYPDRFNALGQIKWSGTIPGLARTMPGGSRPLIGWARSARQMQRVHERPLSVIRVAPLTGEWHLGSIGLLAISFALGISLIPALIVATIGPLWALYYARQAPLAKCHDRLAARLLVAWLALSGPISRTMSRYYYRSQSLYPQLLDRPARQYPRIDWIHRTIRLTYWNDTYINRDSMLERISRSFTSLGCPVVADTGWENFDLLVKPDVWTRIQFRTADEELTGMKIRTSVAARLRLSSAAHGLFASSGVISLTAAFLGLPMVAAAIAVAAAGAAVCLISELIESGRLAYRLVEQCGSELNLVPLGSPVVPARIQPELVEAENPAQTAGH